MTNNYINEKFTIVDDVDLNNQIEKVSDLLNYDPINKLEEIFYSHFGSIIYPILCYKSKAIIILNIGIFRGTYLVKIEEKKVKYLYIGGWTAL